MIKQVCTRDSILVGIYVCMYVCMHVHVLYSVYLKIGVYLVWPSDLYTQGSAGAYEISGRMTAMLGWAGTADFKEKWVFDGAAER